MLPQPLLAPAIKHIFAKMRAIHNSPVGAWQRQFVLELFRVLFAMRGRVNFTNMARYSSYIEQTFRRQFQKAFDWVAFNLAILRLRSHPDEPLLGVFDCSYLPKSGTKTWGLGQFFSSTAGKNKKGLEVSILGVIGTKSGEPVGVDATQTPSISGGRQADTRASTSTASSFSILPCGLGRPVLTFPTGLETAITQSRRSLRPSIRSGLT